jgi:hypothetical protein
MAVSEATVEAVEAVEPVSWVVPAVREGRGVGGEEELVVTAAMAVMVAVAAVVAEVLHTTCMSTVPER